MAFAGGIGLTLDLDTAVSAIRPLDHADPLTCLCFSEAPSRYLLEIDPAGAERVEAALRDAGVPWAIIGRFGGPAKLVAPALGIDASLESLKQAWRGSLDW